MPLTGSLDTEWTETRVRAMGSDAHLLAGDAPADAVAWALAELERLEQCWSRFRPASELSALNAAAGSWFTATPMLLLAISCAADMHTATDGRFDPTILDALEAAGYDRSFEDLDPAPRATAPAPGFARVRVDGDRVYVPTGTRIDLGGIGKGLAADLLARGLVARGARHAVVGLGGDICARGEAPPDGAWHIPVADPFDATRTAFTFSLVDGAIVTSTTRMRAWVHDGRAYHHIIDPRTGTPTATDVVAVVAAARNAFWAEGIAKAMIVAGSDDGARLARAEGIRAWIYRADASILTVTP